MIDFIDGPAAGVSLLLARTPLMLRVVENALSGEWNALDQPDDVAEPQERVHVYRIASKPIGMWIDGHNGRGRWGEHAKSCTYRHCPELHPSDELLRDNAAWAAFCEALPAEYRQQPE